MSRLELEARMGRVLYSMRQNEKELEHIIRLLNALPKEAKNEKDTDDTGGA